MLISATRFVAPVLVLFAANGTPAAPLRVGIVGCDTSHVVAFTRLMNAEDGDRETSKVDVTIAYPGGSSDIPSSRDRVVGFTDALRAQGVEIAASISAVAENSDAILLESVDGRVHLEQFRQVAIGKPVFIDKPMAASLRDVIAIFELAAKTDTPVFTSSALRFSGGIKAIQDNKAIGKLTGCTVASPFQTEPHHPDLFWYGVHGIESVFALMGPGCESVSRIDGRYDCVVTGRWKDGRIAVYRGLKEGGSSYAFSAYGTTGIASTEGFSGYEGLVSEICRFFVTREPPVSADVSIEIFALMEAADQSLALKGRPVSIAETISLARQAAAPTPQNNDP